MAAATATVIAAVALASTVAATGYSVHAQQKAQDEAKDQQSKQDAAVKKQQDALLKSQQDQSAEEAAIRARDSDAAARARSGNQYGGNSSTILTGPLGLSNPAPSTGTKTLLGS